MTSHRDTFADRHIGPDDAEIGEMLAAIGATSLDELLAQAVPDNIREDAPLSLGGARTEVEAIERLREICTDNEVYTSLIGTGYHGTVTPPVIRRNLLENPAWYTAYTPYQPEISQGRLEALFNFQTVVADLTGLELANASMLDEATAAAEAMTLLHRVGRGHGDVFLVDVDCHPQTRAVIETRARPLGLVVRDLDLDDDHGPLDDVFGALIQYPGSSGQVRSIGPIVETLHDAGVLVAVATDLLALTLLTPPGELGADVAIGSAQRFGVPMGFGGPHAGFLATHAAHRRSLPGRLVGLSVDDAGRPALRLALQTREQHIRRERATSNICTAQVLLANIAGLYACWHGPDGLAAIARRVHDHTRLLASQLAAGGVEVVTSAYFDTITVRVPGQAAGVAAAARTRRINLRHVDDDTLGISLDETTTPEIVGAVVESFGLTVTDLAAPASAAVIPDELARRSTYLTNAVFSRHRSETQMLRYLRELADRDIALDRSMIPLGSCTMKLNATTEMEPVTWPELADIHPHAPTEQVRGYLELIAELEAMLVDITGYDAVSLQPNAGSQGELAGLLAIRAYHDDRGDTHRDVCLIPSSAHGTNAASAVMAGMKVVVVECDDRGDIDVADLTTKADEHGDRLAGLMITYPSTHGVFEAAVEQICATVHDRGGQVYLDGANLNAMVGVARPGRFGADVSHLNLHKTFCIPHGGGGPGVGPIGVRAHLAPYLPADPLAADGAAVGPVSAAEHGSAGILSISWAYIAMMGEVGLRKATAVAILNANYVAARLKSAFPILYVGPNERVAHECIVDVRPAREHGISVDDIAKRLIDYGFHAPTMSFPVAGTLMVEPTESESKAELDRFCDSMLAIADEVTRVASGDWPDDDNPLVRAPHPAEDATADEWGRAYPRSLAVYPRSDQRQVKYWPPVGRIDGAHGDKNLVCACPDVDAYR